VVQLLSFAAAARCCDAGLHFVKDVGLRGFPIGMPYSKIGSNAANHKMSLEVESVDEL
jgi:hypothetical protein